MKESAPAILLVLVSVILLAVISVGDASAYPAGGGGPRVVGDKPVGERCVSDVKKWVFEEGLGVPSLGGYDPGSFEFFGWLFFAVMAFAAVLALMVIAFGGVRYIASAGNSAQQQRAKENIRNALFGLILAMGSVLILYTIDPQLTKLRLPALPDAKVPGGVRDCPTTGTTTGGACTDASKPCGLLTGASQDELQKACERCTLAGMICQTGPIGRAGGIRVTCAQESRAGKQALSTASTIYDRA